MQNFKKFIQEENEIIRDIRGKLDKKIKVLNIKDIYFKKSGKKEATWTLSFDDNKGISLNADDWKAQITVYLYNDNPMFCEIEVTNTGTDKRGRSDSELLGKKRIKLSSESDFNKVITFIKNQAKKHFKINL